jgi:poly(A) polymerase
MREIWLMQPRFEKRVGSTPFGLVEQARFRAAFDFMRLRADAGEVDELLADWWQEFSMADDNLRQDLVDQVRAEQQKRPRSPRMQRAPAPEAATGSGNTASPTQVDGTNAATTPASAPDADGQGGDDAFAPQRKRRRRRRSGANRGEGQAGGQGTEGGSPFDGSDSDA